MKNVTEAPGQTKVACLAPREVSRERGDMVCANGAELAPGLLHAARGRRLSRRTDEASILPASLLRQFLVDVFDVLGAFFDIDAGPLFVPREVE